MRCGCSECVYEWYTWFRCARGGVGERGGVRVDERNWRLGLYQSSGDRGECWTCVCVLVAVV